MKWRLLILTLVSIGIYTPIKAEKYKASPLCEAMKKLPYDGHKDLYQAYVESLYKADKTVCSCMQEIMQAKRKNVETLLGEDVAQKIRDEEKRIKKNERYRFFRPCVTCVPGISAQVCSNIKKEYRKTGLKADLVVVPSYTTGVGGEFPSYSLGIDEEFLSQSLPIQNGILGHEFEHLKDRIPDLNNIIKQNMSCYNNKFIKVGRYYESRADRISAAYGTLNSACGLYSFFRKHNTPKNISKFSWNPFVYLNNRIDDLIAKVDDLSARLFDVHPTDRKRFEWASRIFRLKKAEETLTKNRHKKQRESNYWTSLLSFG